MSSVSVCLLVSPPPTHRENKEQLTRTCAKEVFLVQQAIAQDYRADPAMAAACKEDVEKYCKDVKEGGGRKAACLVSRVVDLGRVGVGWAFGVVGGAGGGCAETASWRVVLNCVWC